MERMRTIPVDLILHELATRLAELPDTHHRDLHLAISRGCIRPQALAEEWTHGAGVAQQAAWLVRRLDGEDMTAHRLREIAAETRAMEVAVARRLADCALSLLVTQDAEDRAAASTLLAAAHRVVGLERIETVATTAGAWPPVVTIANLKATEAENANKASIIAKQEKTIANLKSVALVGVAGVIADALHLEAKPGDSDPATLSRRCVEAIEHLQATVDARAKERDVARHDMKNADAESAVWKRERDEAIAETVEHVEQIVAWVSWATKLAGPSPESSQRSANVLRETLSARLIDSKGQRLKITRDCLPDGVDIVMCLRDDKPTTYKASNTGEEYGTPEAAVRAAWEHHLRPTQACTPTTGTIRSVTVNGVTQEVNIPVKAGDTISFSKDNKVVVKPREFKVGDVVVVAREASSKTCDWYDGTDHHLLGKRCTVNIVDDDGDIHVIPRDNSFSSWLAPACLDLVTPTA
jgi:hypothetical protein